jgi:acyl-CoA reductase-like NAD-dependent aldehyde dehydrogenase
MALSTTMKIPKLTIGGRAVEGDAQMDVINPATGRPFAQSPRASVAQLDAAVAAAQAAFPAWSAQPLAERTAVLLAIAQRVEQHVEELATLLTLEQGKPLANARFEVHGAVYYLRHAAQLPLHDELLDETGTRHVRLRRRPLGVVATITPWNFPISLLCMKLPLALLPGNTVVVKPAGTTPLSTLRLVELANEVAPPGVINAIADANDLGEAITLHPGIPKISFTGSTGTGRKVMAGAAAALKRFTLELGGNDAAILLDDIDVPKVASAVFDAAFYNGGQTCLAIKRLYVHDSIHDRVCDALCERADAAIVDDGMHPQATMGPLQNRMQYERILHLLEGAARRGRVMNGGRVDRPGYFVRPTIVCDLPDDDPLVQEEQFGPLLPVLRFSDEQDAVRRANATTYGLGGSVWSSDVARAGRLAEQLQAGTVWVNAHIDMDPRFPLTGAKQSGFGVECDVYGLHEFTQMQVLNFHAA